MLKRFDHVTVVVRDLDAARAFFGLLGFKEDKAVVISGPTFAAYMGIPGIEADHVTLALAGADPRVEVQLLRYRRPEPLTDANIERFDKVGFNHVCFAVDDLEGEVARLRAHGVQMRNDAGLPCAQADLLEGGRRASRSSCPSGGDARREGPRGSPSAGHRARSVRTSWTARDLGRHNGRASPDTHLWGSGKGHCSLVQARGSALHPCLGKRARLRLGAREPASMGIRA